MGHQYAGDGTAYPSDFTIPDDLDDDAAATFDVAFEALGDRTAYILALRSRTDRLTASSGTWTAPARVTEITILSFAGGGGGGGGGAGDTTSPTTRSAPGGGGGGASRTTITRMTVTPGAVLAYVNGHGGSAGSGGASPGGAGGAGGDGADSTFNGVVVSRGGGGGLGAATPFTTTGGLFPATPGGSSPRSTTSGITSLRSYIPAGVAVNNAPCGQGGQGGMGGLSVGQRATDGGCSAEGFAGGALADPGPTVTNLGGGGGGGGGGGPGGVGGDGGVGGSGDVTDGADGGLGHAASANTGAGGGGGGGGGQGGSTGGEGFQGRVGGSGAMSIVYFGIQAVFT